MVMARFVSFEARSVKVLVQGCDGGRCSVCMHSVMLVVVVSQKKSYDSHAGTQRSGGSA